jgi:RNA polymerase sigma factor (sigma-70 family)
MDLESSFELLQQAKGGSKEALDALLDRYWQRIHRWASGRLPRYARDFTDTDDIVQEAVMGLARTIDTFDYRGEWSIQAFLRRSATNRIRSELRRHGSRPQIEALPEQAASADHSPYEAAVGKEGFARYDAALELLSPLEREAVIAWIELGCSYKEIALLIDKPSPDAARMFVSRALEKLARLMAGIVGRTSATPNPLEGV